MAAEEWVRVGEESVFDDQPMQVVDVDDEPVLVCRIAGRYYAVEDRCSHDDGPLGDGVLEGRTVTCPRHGAKFDVTTGAALTMPAVIPIRTYRTKVESGAVWVTA